MEHLASSPELTPRGLATRARIVAAAADLVHRHGAAATSLDAVLAAAGASKSQLYHYFADKDALILAVVEQQAEHVLADNEKLLANLHDLAGLKAWRDAIVAAHAQSLAAEGCPLGSLVGELAGKPRYRAALALGFARWRGYFADGFFRMRTAGKLGPDADPERLATAVIAAMQGGMLLAQAENDAAPLAVALDMAVAQVASFARQGR
jgi:TetR/AcrR family transcriptional regulator, transcriptional repressor for nem operon